MYVGHLAVALASRRVDSRVPLWVALLASQGPDWVELVCSTGVALSATEQYSHSIPAVLVGAALLSAVYAVLTRDGRGALLVAAIYLTHPLLDLLTGAKVLWPGGPAIGAAIYERPGLDFAIESAIVIVGWYAFVSAARYGRFRAVGALILGTMLVCQGILDLGQELRILRRSSNTPNWPFAAVGGRRLPILAGAPAAQFVAGSEERR